MTGIPFDSLVLHGVCRELQQLVGGVVRRASADGSDGIRIRIEIDDREHAVVLSAHPLFYRAHLSSRRVVKLTENWFSKLTQSRAEGGSIQSIAMHGFDRVLLIEISAPKETLILACHFTGSQTNLYLVDSANVILGCMRRTGKLRPGEAYKPPPPPAASLDDALVRRAGLSKFLAAQVDVLGAGEVMKRTTEGPPVLVPGQGAYPFAPPAVSGALPFTSLSEAIEQFAATEQPRADLATRKRPLVGQLRQAVEARQAAIAQLNELLDVASRARELQVKGELILAHANRLPYGSSVLETFDYDGNPITIRLHPDRPLIEEADAFFSRAKRAKANASDAAAKVDLMRAEVLAIESAIDSLTDADEQVVSATEEFARECGWLRKQAAPSRPDERPYSGLRIREASSPGGFEIFYGDNASANDYVTSHLAKSNDLWFHVRGHTGSHVLMKTRNRPDRVQRTDIEFAALIAARNSTQKHAKHVPVDYVLAKHVRKPRKSPPGFATYSQEKTVFVDP